MKYGSEFEIAIKDTAEKGKGVFAMEDIPTNRKIFINFMMPIPEDELDQYRDLSLRHYFFKWEKTYAISLGQALYMNHSHAPNVKIIRYFRENFIEGFSTKPIPAGTELTHKYADLSWFPDHDLWA
ncbi:conserved hypothetical protein [Candidatus Desulfarcum epimagneticum]|uniref:SET domain-containing protein n=1 Tax=uncultured Desulfobacteraceae bacterium TaxID=218296 RepID=A0A484HDC9_9BACT|nr:conserved hypothetical protein [uncultured Desulfobacteraceae bacterium]